MPLTADQIRAAEDPRRTETINVPEWGGDVLVRSLTAAEIETFDNARESGKPMREALVAMVVVGADGNPVWSIADIPEISKRSASAVNRVFKAALRMNGGLAEGEGDAEKK